MSCADARQRLEERQAALVRALARQGPVPEGFDRQRVDAAARSLALTLKDTLLNAELQDQVGLRLEVIH